MHSTARSIEKYLRKHLASIREAEEIAKTASDPIIRGLARDAARQRRAKIRRYQVAQLSKRSLYSQANPLRDAWRIIEGD